MKILLISANTATDPYAVYPLGLGVIASALQADAHEVSIFDFLQSGESLAALAKKVTSLQPALVGISIRNIDNTNAAHELRYIDVVKQIVDTIREAGNAPIVLGGAGYSIMPGPILEMVGADYGVVGEGEELVRSLVKDLEAGNAPAEKLLHAGTKLIGPGITPAYYEPDLLDQYLNIEGITPIQSKRGCNRQCVYCTYPLLEGHKIRAREAHAVVDDIEHLVSDQGVRQIFFVDSVFNDSDGEYRNLIAEMHQRKINIPWSAFFSPGRELDDDAVAQMKATGLESAEIGGDATTDETLRGLRKGFVWDDVVRTNELFLKHGITTTHSYMFGGPDETPDTVERGIANICSLRETANFVFMGIRILPGTPLWKRAVTDGIITEATDLLESVYYFSPHVDRDWLEARLTEAFADRRDCIFPPDAINTQLQFLHRMKRLQS